MNTVSFLGYIDPGTGSMLFAIVLGLITTCIFLFRGFFIKFKIMLQGEKISEGDDKMPFVIFTDSKRYWNVFADICDEFERRELECHYYTASPDDPVFEREYKFVQPKFIGEGNKGIARLNMMKAEICLATTPGLDVLQWKRSKDVDWYVHIYHGLDDSRGYRMFGLDYFDAILATGEIQEPTIRALEEMRGTPRKEVVIVGSADFDYIMRKAEGYKREPNEITTVLLAPSWGDSSILNRFGERIISALVATGYKIIIRPHPQTKQVEEDMLNELQAKFPESDMLSWNYDNDNFKVLSQADIMISDYSSVIWDYLFTFERPFIYADTNHDRSPYDAAWFDDTPWLFRSLEQLGIKLDENEFDNLKSIIDGAIASEKFKANLERIRNEGWNYRGEAYKRTVDYMVQKREELREEAKVRREEELAKVSGKKNKTKKEKGTEEQSK